MKKILYILRHAKAEPLSGAREDHARHLISRGTQNARSMGKYMAAHGIKPDKVLCSSAARTQETWQEMALPDVQCQFTDKLYLASANALLTLLSDIPDTVHSLLLIGHNPGLHELALKLAKDGDQALISKLGLKFPTCTLATIALDNMTWRDISRARGTLAGFVTPKML